LNFSLGFLPFIATIFLDSLPLKTMAIYGSVVMFNSMATSLLIYPCLLIFNERSVQQQCKKYEKPVKQANKQVDSDFDRLVAAKPLLVKLT
jgi:hypothetical protein